MQVQVEKTSVLERRLTIGLPAEQVESEIDQRLRKTAPQVNMKGFRPGKVPMRVVRQRYGQGIRQEVLADLVQKSFQDAVTQENLRPTGMPAVEQVDTEGDQVEFVCTFEVYPDVELPDFSAMQIEKPECEISDADIDEMIQKLRERRPEWTPVERAAQAGDQVRVDFEGTIDGEPFQGNKGENIDFEIGSGYMLPEFESGVEGASAGEAREIEVNFPEDYPSEEVKGRTAKFTVKVTQVSEKKLPELDENFFKAWGIEGNDLEAFRAEVKSTMADEVERAVKAKVKEQVIQGLLDATEMDLPASLVDAEVHRLQHANQKQGHDHGHDHHDHGEATPEMREQAERRVRTGLLMMEIVRSQELKADAGRVRAMVEKLARPYGDPEQVINYYYGDENRLAEIESAVLEEQVVEWVTGQASVTAKPASYKEFTEAAGGAS